MAKALLAVRAEVPEAERARFDHWYETDHLPWALRTFEERLVEDVAAQSGVAFRNALLETELAARVKQGAAQSARRRRTVGQRFRIAAHRFARR